MSSGHTKYIGVTMKLVESTVSHIRVVSAFSAHYGGLLH